MRSSLGMRSTEALLQRSRREILTVWLFASEATESLMVLAAHYPAEWGSECEAICLLF